MQVFGNNNPKDEYIRTFEEDLKAAQAGESQSVEGSQLPPPPPPPPSASGASEASVPPPPPPVSFIPREPVLPSPATAAPRPQPQSKAPSYKIPTVTEASFARARAEHPENTPIETYEGDFSALVKEKQASPVAVLAAEQDSIRVSEVTPLPVENETDDKKKNLIFIGVGAALLLVGVVGVYFAYMYYVQRSAPVEVATGNTLPIFVDEEETMSGVGVSLIQQIKTYAEQDLPTGSVRALYNRGTSTPENILIALQAQAPGLLTRNIDPKKSMLGVIDVNGVQSPFFIFSVMAYGSTYSGMRSWEPRIRKDLEALFPPFPQPEKVIAPAAQPVASSTEYSATTSLALATTTQYSEPAAPPADPTSFVDSTVLNHDVRMYRDSSGMTVMVYGYWDQKTLVIARDVAAMTELFQRLSTTRTQP